ncbi:helix-turn-helix domain-containing protein [Candidatus Sulfidibacterium hydrothermale]|uniref:helix-turn-helix transcriptional regulator n=1 Tax=Candidatus Sulfidibacterium hydrothermale TaxID=2875962 RepID=UPI001F0B6DA1|nr:helix-turn-helix domain-containing protein [Candidatus Sulfidibacterium hydrothermale]UBM62783.1 helix-turn-helix domain-containing protein [Candidatus Sulfidibacterium hydrothermale]
MSNIQNLLLENPDLAKNITIQVKGYDLLNFADKLVKQTALEVEQRIKAENKPDKLLTRQQVSETLDVSLSTLWHWEKKGILVPLKIGSKVRYRQSDVEKAITKK